MLRTIPTLLCLICLADLALATECPQGAQRCKVVVLVPEEEQALVGPNGILDTAEKGAFVQLSGPVQYFRKKIADAPAGEVKKPEPAK